MTAETIVAIATPPGQGGVGIVRISGPLSSDIARAIIGRLPAPRRATMADFTINGQVWDRGMGLFFPAPHSFTGEDVLELHAHGSPVVLDALVEECVRLGARQARAGEFSERAFCHGKMDLTQAEAVASLISSHDRRSARAALRAMRGAFSEKVKAIAGEIMNLRVEMEAGLDFSEEEDIPGKSDPRKKVAAVESRLKNLLAQAQTGWRIRQEVPMALLGPPNTGKSTLLNHLAQKDAAITSPRAGTTRDALEERINLNGAQITLCDTAGLRSSEDTIEKEGMRRAVERAREADYLLIVYDQEKERKYMQDWLARHKLQNAPPIWIRNKCDKDKTNTRYGKINGEEGPCFFISALKERGVQALKDYLHELVLGTQPSLADTPEDTFSARRRQVETVRQALDCLQKAKKEHEPETIAEELAICQRKLGEITGEVNNESLLGEIFSRFCIGK